MENKIVNLIKSLRLSRNISQTEMSEIAGITISTYNLKENKKKPFKFDELFKIFNFLDIALSIDYSNINTNSHLIKKIIISRNRSNLTQDALRQKLNLSYPSYAKRETGKIVFTLPEVIEICNILELKIIVRYYTIKCDKIELIED